MKNFTRKMAFLGLVAGLLLPQGCLLFWVGTGAAAGAAGAAYVTGELRATERVPLDRAWQATREAVGQLEMPVAQRQKDALSAWLVSRTADNKEVTIRLRAIDQGTTEIRIRVGTFGDEARSRQILSRIQAGY